jgi:tetratricopeptide (TPR) repeat protein
MKMSRAVLAASLLAGTATLLPAPASAQALDSLRQRQSQNRQQQQQPQQRGPARIGELSREESAAIMPLYTAVQASDWPTATGALAAAQAGARTPAARYLVGQLILQIGRGTNNQQMQAQAVDAMLASGGAPAEALPILLDTQADFAIRANNFAAAEPALTRIIEANPNNVDRILQLAEVKNRLNKAEEANALYQRALQLSSANGGTAPEALYRRLLGAAYQARSPQAPELARNLVRAYPSAANWHDALVIYAELGNANSALKLDTYRLMRAAGAMTTERDFLELSEAANEAHAYGEVKSTLEEGLRRNLITTNAGYARERLGVINGRVAGDRESLGGERAAALRGSDATAPLRLADAYFGYGDYAPAAELYRAALQKGGDANLVNIRLGAALALAGNRAEAETAFRAVTGPRAELAQLWLLWLSTRR